MTVTSIASVTLVRFSPHDGDHVRTAELVECYREVFADTPWHEWLKCPQCQQYWGKKDGGVLVTTKFRHCGTPLVDFWSREQVVSDLYQEITPSASCWLALHASSVVGFCFGYAISVTDLEKKLAIRFSHKLAEDGGGVVAYQDEVGVLATFRGHKIAKAMFANRLEDFLADGLRTGIVRTREFPEPSQTFLWYTEKLGYKILARYPGDDGRVILGREFKGLKELLASS